MRPAPRVFLILLLAASALPVPCFGVDAVPAVEQEQASPSAKYDEPLYADEAVEVDRQKTVEIPVEDLERLLIADPSIAEVSQMTERDRIFVRGLVYGETYIHLWTASGRKTVYIKVTPPVRARREKGARKRPFQMTHRFSSNVRTTTRQQSNTTSRDQNLNYQLGLNGNVPAGYLNSSVYLTEVNGKRQFSSARLGLTNRLGHLMAGDANASFSRLVLPQSSFQGLAWNSPRFGNMFSLSLIGGSTSKKWWGEGSSYYSGQQESGDTLGGVKVGVAPHRNVEFFVAGSEVAGSSITRRYKNQGFGGRVQRGDLSLRGEGANSDGANAWFGEMEYQKEHGYFLLAQRNVGAYFTTFNGQSWSQGQVGQSFQGGLKKIGLLEKADLRYDQFQSRYMPNPLSPDALNRSWIGSIVVRSGDAELDQGLTFQNYQGAYNPSELDLYNTKISYRLPFGEPNVSFRRETGLYSATPNQSYSDTGIGVGFRAMPYDFLTFGFSAESFLSREIATGRKKSGVNLQSGFRLQGAPWLPSLNHSLDVDYNHSAHSLAGNTDSFSAQYRTEYSMGKDFSIFVLGGYENRMSATSPSYSMNFKTGINWGTSFGAGWRRSRKVKGFVYRDLNGDGIRQADEPGLEGVRIHLNGDDQIVKTDADGQYEFKSAKGDLSVRLETSDLPPNSRLSSSNPQMFEASDSGSVQAVFSVAHTGSIWGSVYLDANENGELDEGDSPVRSVKVALDGNRSESTDPVTGQFSFQGVKPGTHHIQLDVLTLPENTLLSSPTDMELELVEGGKEQLVFLVKPVRLLGGVLFWDENGDGRRDPQEPGVPGIRIFTEFSEMLSDEDGSFYLNHFKGGTVSLDVSKEALQKAGWQLLEEGILPRTFDVPLDQPFVQRNIGIPLRKARK